jgi:hypothetical protein
MSRRLRRPPQLWSAGEPQARTPVTLWLVVAQAVEESDFVVEPEAGLLLWLVLAAVATAAAAAGAIVLALKRQWLWLAVGIAVWPVLLVGPFVLAARPDSPWARRKG